MPNSSKLTVPLDIVKIKRQSNKNMSQTRALVQYHRIFCSISTGTKYRPIIRHSWQLKEYFNEISIRNMMAKLLPRYTCPFVLVNSVKTEAIHTISSMM